MTTPCLAFVRLAEFTRFTQSFLTLVRMQRCSPRCSGPWSNRIHTSMITFPVRKEGPISISIQIPSPSPTPHSRHSPLATPHTPHTPHSQGKLLATFRTRGTSPLNLPGEDGLPARLGAAGEDDTLADSAVEGGEDEGGEGGEGGEGSVVPGPGAGGADRRTMATPSYVYDEERPSFRPRTPKWELKRFVGAVVAS